MKYLSLSVDLCGVPACCPAMSLALSLFCRLSSLQLHREEAFQLHNFLFPLCHTHIHTHTHIVFLSLSHIHTWLAKFWFYIYACAAARMSMCVWFLCMSVCVTNRSVCSQRAAALSAVVWKCKLSGRFSYSTITVLDRTLVHMRSSSDRPHITDPTLRISTGTRRPEHLWAWIHRTNTSMLGNDLLTSHWRVLLL